MSGALIPIGIILLIWIGCLILRQIGFFSDFQFISITVAIVVVLLLLGRYAYLVLYK